MHIDLRQLRHFIALHEHRSFVAAALAVNLSQSAFSRSIQALEHSAGCRLVDRAAKDLRPTKQGLIVLEHARRLVSGAHNLANEIALFNGLEAGELRFGAGPAPATWLVPRAVGRFNVRYPKARVSFQVEHWQALNRRLQAEEFEFFVADTRHFEADPQYRTSRLRPRRWHFCCREGHPLAARESVSAEELLSFPLATNISPPNIRKVLVDLSGRPDFRPAIECENGHSLLGVVLASDAIGISSGLGDLAPPGQGGLRPLRVRELPDDLDELHTRYGIVSRAGYSLAPLGVGDRLLAWGVPPGKVRQLDWWQGIEAGGLRLTATPAQHFSGRGLHDGNRTLWCSWVIESAELKLFFSGDSGYFDGFAEIGRRYGPFDLTMLETGAYNEHWPYVHMHPQQTLQAHRDLGGRWLLPIHNGTFDLAMHAWYEPFERILELATEHGVRVSTPMMGERIDLQAPHAGRRWWREVVDSETQVQGYGCCRS